MPARRIACSIARHLSRRTAQKKTYAQSAVLEVSRKFSRNLARIFGLVPQETARNEFFKGTERRPKNTERKLNLMKNRNITCVTVIIALGLFALSIARAVSPAPDGGYQGGNTAEGQAALRSLTTGTYNTAVGFLSLTTNTEGSFNTATGAG